MQEQERCASASTTENNAPSPPAARWADVRCLALLILVTISLRAWQIAHTEVASRDSISYIRIAWHLQHGAWREVLPRSSQHPGYPLAVLGMSLPVRHFIPDDLPRAWQLSAQLASAAASVLLVVVMFYFGRELFDRRIAFWACLLFQCLPCSGKVMGDGLSDTLFLLFACVALWMASLALRRGLRIAFALSGLAGGLAYLTRPEGALIVGVAGLVLLAMQFSRRLRRSWRSVLLDGSTLSATALATMLPYMLVIGGLTVKNTPNLLLNQQRPDADWEGQLRPHARSKIESPALASAGGAKLWAIWWHPSKTQIEKYGHITDPAQLQHLTPPPRYGWAFYALCYELNKGFFYLFWLPALLGMWWYRDRFPVTPGAWVMTLVCLMLCALLFRMAEKMGYLSDRHLLLVIMCGIYPAAAGVLVVGDKLALGAARLWPSPAGRRWLGQGAWMLALPLLLAVLPLPRTLAQLHGERAGFRSVGYWMAENTFLGNYIEDPYCWTAYYAGRVFVEGCANLPIEPNPCYYVVLELSNNRHPHLVTLQSAMVHALESNGSEIIHRESAGRGKEQVSIAVWRVPGNYQWQPRPALPGQR